MFVDSCLLYEWIRVRVRALQQEPSHALSNILRLRGVRLIKMDYLPYPRTCSANSKICKSIISLKCADSVLSPCRITIPALSAAQVQPICNAKHALQQPPMVSESMLSASTVAFHRILLMAQCDATLLDLHRRRRPVMGDPAPLPPSCCCVRNGLRRGTFCCRSSRQLPSRQSLPFTLHTFAYTQAADRRLVVH